LARSAEREIPQARFLFCELFSLPLADIKEKSEEARRTPKSVCQPTTRFFFSDHEAKRKSLAKRNANERISPVATGDEGYAPSTAPPFEKGGRKLSAAAAE